jgi:putative lipoic acid-binding regulatory protein
MRYHSSMDDQESALTFPCVFPIKVMGASTTGFEAPALEIVRRHAPGFETDMMRVSASRQGNYISVTFDIPATSREQLDAIYRELTARDDVLMVL